MLKNINNYNRITSQTSIHYKVKYSTTEKSNKMHI